MTPDEVFSGIIWNNNAAIDTEFKDIMGTPDSMNIKLFEYKGENTTLLADHVLRH
jgi:hypothetical protein